IEFLCEALQLPELPLSGGPRFFCQFLKETIHLFRGFSHTFLKNIMCIGWKTEQIGFLVPQFDNLQYVFLVIQLISMEALCTEGKRHLFSKLPVFGILHKGKIAWVVQVKDPAFLVLRFCQQSCSTTCTMREALQVLLICQM